MPVKWIIILLAFLSLIIGISTYFVLDNSRPINKLALMSSIPLGLGEVNVEQMVRGESNPSAAYISLKKHYDIILIDAIDDRLSQVNLLLLAQARPLSGPELVALDKWVRKGGQIIILSDAALQWPSDYALGDKRRPIYTSLLSPLFAYWGLEQLLLVEEIEEHSIALGDYSINTVTPSEWVLIETDSQNVDCTLNNNRFEANCRVGKGRAILIGDSDFIHDRHWQSYYGEDDNMLYLLHKLQLLTNLGE